MSTTRGVWMALTVPSSGTVTAKSESTSSRKASNSGSALSISSIKSSAGAGLRMAARIGLGKRNRSLKKRSSDPAIRSAACESVCAPAMVSAILSFNSCVYRSCLAYSHSYSALDSSSPS